MHVDREHQEEVQSDHGGQGVEEGREAASLVGELLEEHRRDDAADAAAGHGCRRARGARPCRVDLAGEGVHGDEGDVGEGLDAHVAAMEQHHADYAALRLLQVVDVVPRADGKRRHRQEHEPEAEQHDRLGGHEDAADQRHDAAGDLPQGPDDQGDGCRAPHVHIGHDLREGVQAAVVDDVEDEATVDGHASGVQHLHGEHELHRLHDFLQWRAGRARRQGAELDAHVGLAVVVPHRLQHLDRLVVLALDREVARRLIQKEQREYEEHRRWDRAHQQQPTPIQSFHIWVVVPHEHGAIQLAENEGTLNNGLHNRPPSHGRHLCALRNRCGLPEAKGDADE
mmetsp:Transcript_106245/g.297436  ORF Transcript_106245/g.297436 Transcript_106245/m.297436 type:complete len:340 (-) Transcript_106245:404-1423(-)